NLLEFGNALAGRGQDLNVFIGELNPLLRNLEPVMRNLAARPTHLARLFQALGRTAGIVTPVAQTQGDLFVNLDTTFTALSQVTTDIQRTIVTTPPAEATAIRVLPFQR